MPLRARIRAFDQAGKVRLGERLPRKSLLVALRDSAVTLEPELSRLVRYPQPPLGT